MIRLSDMLTVAAAAMLSGTLLISDAGPDTRDGAADPQAKDAAQVQLSPRQANPDLSATDQRRLRLDRRRPDRATDHDHARTGEHARRQPVTSEVVEESIEVLCEIDPERCEKMQQRRLSDPESFDRIFAQQGRKLIALSHLKRTRPELYEHKLAALQMERKAIEVARRLHEARAAGAGESAVRGIEQKLRSVVREQMNQRILTRASELKLLENHVLAMREELREDAHRLDELIAQRFDYLADPANFSGETPVDTTE